MGTQRNRATILVAAVASVALVMVLAVGTLTGPRADASSSADATFAAAENHGHMKHQADVSLELSFHDTMRRLWEDHVTWTRLFIVSFVHDLPDLDETTDRLLRNQVDLGDAIEPYYGDAAGERLTELLTEHITTAATLLQAAKANDAQAFEDANDAWYRNGRQIARFLHEANPDNWGLRDMKTMMRDHLDLTLAEAAARLEGDYVREIAGYDAVHVEILEMADMLSDGIIRQFPEKF